MIETAELWALSSSMEGGANELLAALNALRASRQPQRCEPPEEFRGERWHWLEHTSSFEPWAFNGTGWYRGHVDAPLMSPEYMGAAGWRYIGPAHPPVQQVEPTDEEIREFIEELPSLETGDAIDDAIHVVRSSLTRFKSPQPVELTDEEISGIWHKSLFPNGKLDHHKFARSIIAKSQGKA